MSITVNPSATITPSSSFLPQSQGYTQGITLADPTSRQWLNSGVIASTVSAGVWGGMGITESVQMPGNGMPGNLLTIAGSSTAVTGFTVFDRAYNMIIVPGNSVQIALAGMSMAFYRLGSNARIPVLCTAGLITAIETNSVNTQVVWDFTNQQLIPYTSGTALPVKVIAVDTNSKIVSVSGSTYSWTTGNVAVIQI